MIMLMHSIRWFSYRLSGIQLEQPILMTTKQLIKEYVEDHFNAFGFYPYDVEVDGVIFSYGNYWSILEDDS